MVHLVLSSTQGNQGQRYFPHGGYLGLTPVRVQGIVRTRLDADGKRLPAKSISISVRCYEARVGRLNTLTSNLLVDCTHTLWAKPDAADYEPIGDLEFPFRISVPARVNGFSTAVFVDYRCVWRIEAVLHHAPIAGLGSRQVRHFELPLVRYDLPPPRILPPPSLRETTKPRAPRIRYSLSPPTAPIGPHDLVAIPIHLQPLDPIHAVRSASVIVERRITLHDVPDDPPPAPASALSLLEHAPLLPAPASSTKVITNSIAGVQSSGPFVRDNQGTWSKTLTLEWPAPKSHSRWAIGETISSDLVSVNYFIRTKIIVTSASGTESLDLAEHELHVVSTNEAERQLALAKYAADAQDPDSSLAPPAAARSKSKSPRRSPRPADSAPPLPKVQNIPSPWTLPAARPPRPTAKARRPHTSAGPRDRPTDFAGGAYAPSDAPDGSAKKRRKDARPDTASSLLLGGSGGGFWSTVHANGGTARPEPGASTSTTGSASSSGKSSRSDRVRERRREKGKGKDNKDKETRGAAAGKEAHMREWEEELARIEVRSRRSSDLLGFAGRMKRAITGGAGGGGSSPPVPVPVPVPMAAPVACDGI